MRLCRDSAPQHALAFLKGIQNRLDNPAQKFWKLNRIKLHPPPLLSMLDIAPSRVLYVIPSAVCALKR